MFEVKFYTFAKKENSTKMPTNSELSYTTNCTIKSPSSVVSPRIVLDIHDVGNNPSHWNYAYIQIWGRFYFIRDWINIDNLWEARLECDVLATYKNQIGNTTEYILRSYSLVNDSIIDAYYPTESTPVYDYFNIGLGTIYTPNIVDGTFIVGIVNQDSPFGAVSYYAFDLYNFRIFCEYLLDTPDYLIEGGIQAPWDLDINKSTLKAMYNPMQYIVSCKWFPIKYNSIGMSGVTTTPKLGWWDLPNCNALALVFDIGTVGDYSLCFPRITAHPEYVQSPLVLGTGFLNYPPYSNYRLYLPPFGDFELDGSKCGNMLANYDFYQFELRMKVDYITGDAYLYSCELRGNTGDPIINNYILSSDCKISVEIPIAQITSDNLKKEVAQFQGLGNIISNISRLNFGGAISATASAVYDSLMAGAPKGSVMGSSGGFSAFVAPSYVESKHMRRVSTDRESHGRPCCTTSIISRSAGYTKCLDSHAEIDGAMKEEQEKIKGFLDGGFFYE